MKSSELFDPDKRECILPGTFITVEGERFKCVETSDAGCRSNDNRRCALFHRDIGGHGCSACCKYDCVFPHGGRTMRVVFLPAKEKGPS